MGCCVIFESTFQKEKKKYEKMKVATFKKSKMYLERGERRQK